MKMLSVVLMFFLIGCAGPTIEELEAEATLTGDWSRVERKERQQARMNKSMNRIEGESKCNFGHIYVCQTEGEREECGCVSPLDRGLRE